MSGLYPGWVHVHADGPFDPDAVANAGRQLLERILEQRQRFGLFQGVLRRVLWDGTRLSARFVGDIPIIEVEGAAGVSSNPISLPSQIWIPQGFILYPVSDASPTGWGTPVIPDAAPGVGPYDTTNLAPGLGVTRWTVNGRLGEVLLTQVVGAGYPNPALLVAPYLASQTVGITLTPGYTPPQSTPNWAAYRVEFIGFSAQSPSADLAEQGQIIGSKREFFEIVNKDRVSLGLTPFLLPIRGRFDTAQATAEVCSAASTIGHDYLGYPTGYQASSDRTAKDGLVGYLSPATAASRDVGNNTAEEQAASGTIVQSFPDPSGFPTTPLTNLSAISAQQAFDLYLSDPPHKLGLEARQWNGGHTSIQYGFKGAFQATHIFPNTAWVHAGNRFWNSANSEIQTLSWFGFQSLNLGYETYPVIYNNHYEIVRNGYTPPPPNFDPLTQAYNFINPDGSFWLTAYYAYDTTFVYGQTPTSQLNFSAEQVPFNALVMDNRLFLRGRCIAIAPPIPGANSSGYFWAAAIQKFDSPDSNADTVYRLVALVHHPEDQPSDWKTYGMTPYLRVWYCDIPNDGQITCAPHSIIREAYGNENHGWPWDVVNSPYSWKGGILVDVGTTDGVTRDSLKYSSQWVFSSDGMRAICLRDQGTYAQYASFWDYYGDDTTIFIGQTPRALELTFGGNAFSPLTVSAAWRSANAGLAMRNVTGLGNVTVTPMAAGYDINDNDTFAMLVQANTPKAGPVYSLAFGDYDMQPMTQAGTVCSALYAQQDLPGIGYSWPVVMDVRDQAFLTISPYQQFQVDASSGRVSANPAFNGCFTNTTLPVGQVNVWRQGALLHSASFSNPDNVMPSPFSFDITSGGLFTWLQLSLTDQISPSYTSNGKDWVFSYTLVPQAEVAFTVSNPVLCTGCAQPCALSVHSTLFSVDPAPPYNVKPACRGRWIASSIPGIAALTQIPGANVGTLYARAV